MHPHGVKKFALRGPCFVAVFLRVEIERRLYFAVTQDSLHGLGLDLRLVHQPVAEGVAKIVKPETLTVRNLHSCFLCGRSEIVGDECGSA
jgi:hypothetical protein